MTSQINIKASLGGIFLMGFEGTTVSQNISSLVQDYRLGAILLNASNFTSAEQAQTLIHDLQLIAHNAGHEHPLLIAIDQENGLVRSISDPRWITQFPSSLGIAATRSTENAFQVALATGREMACLGVNWIIGPALDVIIDRDVPGFGSRTFGDDPELVTKLGSASIRGFREAGVASCAKHFPLGGSLKFDEHSTKVPVVSKSLGQFRQKVLRPFQEAIREGVDAVMVCGVAISSISSKIMPACLSKKVVTDLLHDQLGHRGITVSECLEMESLAPNIGVGQAATMAIHAGCDLLTICRSFPRQLEAVTSLELAIKNGGLSWDLVQRSIKRINALRANHSSWSQALHPPGIQQLATLREQHTALSARIYEQSITLLRDDDGSIPLSRSLGENGTVLILSPILRHRNNSPPSSNQHPRHLPAGANILYGEEYFMQFGRSLASHDVGQVIHTSYTSQGVRAEHERYIESANAIIILVADANRNHYQLSFAKHVSALCKFSSNSSKKRLVIVSMSSSFDVPVDERFPAHICIYDSSPPALDCLARIMGGRIQPPGFFSSAPARQDNRASNKASHQQSWLVEPFDQTRDQKPLETLLREVTKESKEHTFSAVTLFSPTWPAIRHKLLLVCRDIEEQSFVIRNTSTNALYGYASALYSPRSERGYLDSFLVDPNRRRISMGTDLHTSVMKHLLQKSGIKTIHLGIPLLGLYPGLPGMDGQQSSSSVEFFRKLGWQINGFDRFRVVQVLPERVENTPWSTAQTEQAFPSLEIKLVDDTSSLGNILRGLEQFPLRGDGLDEMIYDCVLRAAIVNGVSSILPIRIIVAQEKASSDLVGCLLMLSDSQTLSPGQDLPNMDVVRPTTVPCFMLTSPLFIDKTEAERLLPRIYILHALISYGISHVESIREHADTQLFFSALSSIMPQDFTDQTSFSSEFTFTMVEQAIDSFA